MKHTPATRRKPEERDAPQSSARTNALSSPSTDALPDIVKEPDPQSGQPLDAATRAYMEPRLGHDFSQVRIHADDNAARAASALHANAFTMQNHVMFGAHRRPDDRRLMAHELTHVAQQRMGETPLVGVSSAEDFAEREASAIAEQIAGGAATTLRPTQQPSAFIHRDGPPTAAPAPPQPPAAPATPATPGVPAAPDAAVVDPKVLAEEEQRAYDAVMARVGYPAAEVRFTSFAAKPDEKPELEIFNIAEVVPRPVAEPKRLGFDSEGAAKVFATNVSKDTGAIVLKQDKFFFVAKIAKGKHVLRTKKETFLDESKVTGVGDAAVRTLTFGINSKWFGSGGADQVFFVQPYNQIVAVSSIEGMLFPLMTRLEPDAARMAFQSNPDAAKPPEAADLRAFAGMVPDGQKPDDKAKIPEGTAVSPEQEETFINNYFRARGLEALNENEKMVDKLAADFAPTTSGTKEQKGSGVSEKAKALIDASRVIGALYKEILDKEAKFNANVDYIETRLTERRKLMGEEERQKPIMLVVDGKTQGDYDWRRELKEKQSAIDGQKRALMSGSPLLAQLVAKDPKSFTNEWADTPQGKVHLATTFGTNPYDNSLLGKGATAENDEKIREEFSKKLDNVRKAVRRARAEIIGGDMDTLLRMDGLQRRVKADFTGMSGKNAALKPRLDKIIETHQIKEIAWTIAETVISVGLLFVPGGQFLSAAVGFAAAAKDMDKNLTNWSVSQASVDPAKALVDQQAAEQALGASTIQLVVAGIMLGESTIGALNALDGGTKVVKPPSTIEPPNQPPAKPPEVPPVDPHGATAVDPAGKTQTATTPPNQPVSATGPTAVDPSGKTQTAPGTAGGPPSAPAAGADAKNPMAQSAPAPAAAKPGEPPQGVKPAEDPHSAGTVKPGEEPAPLSATPASGPQFTPLPTVIMEDKFVEKELSAVLKPGAEPGQAAGKIVLQEKDSGKFYLLKPADQEKAIVATEGMGIPPGQRARRAPAASIIGDQMATGTPKSDLVLYKGKVYSRQQWIPNATYLNDVYKGMKAGDPRMVALWNEIKASQAWKDADAFQYMIAGLDANYGNFIAELDAQGKFVRLVPIDMDASLPPKAARFTPMAEFNGKPIIPLPQSPLPDTVSKGFERNLRHMSDNRAQLTRVLEYYLAPKEIEGLLARVDEILKKIDSGVIFVQ